MVRKGLFQLIKSILSSHLSQRYFAVCSNLDQNFLQDVVFFGNLIPTSIYNQHVFPSPQLMVIVIIDDQTWCKLLVVPPRLDKGELFRVQFEKSQVEVGGLKLLVIKLFLASMGHQVVAVLPALTKEQLLVQV